MLSSLLKKFDAPLNFCARVLHGAGLTPTTLSFLGLLFALSSAFFYYFSLNDQVMRMLAFFTLLGSGFFDALDGAVARLSSQVTKLGGVLDSVMDRVGEISIYSGIILGRLSSIFIGLFTMGTSVLVSYVRARSEAEGVVLKGIGVAERPERILILAVATFIGYVEVGLIIISALATITLVQRLSYVSSSLS